MDLLFFFNDVNKMVISVNKGFSKTEQLEHQKE